MKFATKKVVGNNSSPHLKSNCALVKINRHQVQIFFVSVWIPLLIVLNGLLQPNSPIFANSAVLYKVDYQDLKANNVERTEFNLTTTTTSSPRPPDKGGGIDTNELTVPEKRALYSGPSPEPVVNQWQQLVHPTHNVASHMNPIFERQATGRPDQYPSSTFNENPNLKYNQDTSKSIPLNFIRELPRNSSRENHQTNYQTHTISSGTPQSLHRTNNADRTMTSKKRLRDKFTYRRLNALLSLQNPNLLGGDILLRTEGKRRTPGKIIKFERAALVNSVSLWPNGVIFYELDISVFHLADLIWKVMQQFHEETCIRFLPRENNEPDFLRIEAFKGCFSYIGRIGGEQILSLGDGCEYRGTIAHELLHAVGFYHHQNRSDRDDFLEVLWDNIARGKENQFDKMKPEDNILLNTFDYDSIMLYGPHTFGKTLDKVTMKPKREGVILLEISEKQGLSALDISSINKLYKCETAANLYKRR